MFAFIPSLALLIPSGFAAPPATGRFATPPQDVRSTATTPFLHFESGAVHPMRLSPTGNRLYVLNTPDHRLEVYDAPSLTHLGSVFTGLEPVAIAEDPADTTHLFVVNHLSDSVAVVDATGLRLLTTIDVGDEPRDAVVTNGKLFVSCSLASQSGTTDFIENAIAVFDAQAPYSRLAQIPLPAHQPRALVTDGSRVFVIPQNSGNHTTLLPWKAAETLIGDQTVLDSHDQQFPFTLNEALTDPRLDQFGLGFGAGWAIPTAPRIVFDHEFPARVPQLADHDILAIDSNSLSLVNPTTTGVGTTLFDLERNPITGKLWVAATESLNRTRMEYNLRGAAFENRVVIAAPGGAVEKILRLDASFTGGAEHAQPVALEFYSGNQGNLAYVACMGTSAVLVLDPTTGAFLSEIPTHDLPIGLAVDAARDWLYVFCRGESRVQVFDIAQGHSLLRQLDSLAYDPEPALVRRGRKHLYEARSAGGHGTGNFSCASCHVFGHHDFLAWDLGDSAGGLGYFYPEVMRGKKSVKGIVTDRNVAVVNPMKGPMTTQSLRGLGDLRSLPLHWRGDRRFMQMFRGAFETLLGGSGITAGEMQEMTAFLRGLKMPPNPYQSEDRLYHGLASEGADLFGMNPKVAGKPYNKLQGITCIECHQGSFSDGAFFEGTQRTVNFDGDVQLLNAPSLRGIYDRQYPELTGFGLRHDGSSASIRDFLDASQMIGSVDLFPIHTADDRDRIAVFIEQWDSGLAPLVGRQSSFAPGSGAQLDATLDYLEPFARGGNRHVDLTFTAWVETAPHQYLQQGGYYAFDTVKSRYRYLLDDGQFVERRLLRDLLRQPSAGLTITAVPPGWGHRIGVDQDEDSLVNAAEREVYGTRPDDPDTDGDGYDDSLELDVGSNPLVSDFTIPDSQPPSIRLSSIEAIDPFTNSATLIFEASEPVYALIELGLPNQGFNLPPVQVNELRRRHEVVLSELPAASSVIFRLTATDLSDLSSPAVTGRFKTMPPLFHIDSLNVSKSGSGPYDLMAEVLVIDHEDQPVENIEVQGFWYSDANDLNQLVWNPIGHTDAAGIARLPLSGYNPAGPVKLTFMPAYIGSMNPNDPYFVGRNGKRPNYFYFQPANQQNFASISLP